MNLIVYFKCNIYTEYKECDLIFYYKYIILTKVIYIFISINIYNHQFFSNIKRVNLIYFVGIEFSIKSL